MLTKASQREKGGIGMKGMWIGDKVHLVSLGLLVAVFLIGGCASTPKDIQLVNAASGAFDQRRYDQCIADCTKAIRVNARSYFAYNLRGNCRQGKKEYGLAIEDFKTALQFYPGWEVAQSNLQTSLKALEREKRARQIQAATGSKPTPYGSVTPYQTTSPDVVIYHVEVKPERIPAGSQFELSFEYSITDPSVKDSKLPASYHFKILQGTKVLTDSGPFELNSPNGMIMPRTVNMKASKNKGTYAIQVFLQYKKNRVDKTTRFVIE